MCGKTDFSKRQNDLHSSEREMQNNLKITLFFLNWNDSFYLPFIKHHYGVFCQRIVMYDNHSDDGSQELALRLGFEVRTFGYSNRLDDQDYLNVKNQCWKEERENGQKADRVIVCDADEFLVIPGTTSLCQIPKVEGYNIISEFLPQGESIFELNTGNEAINYSKQVIFDPNVVTEINFVHGCHQNNMVTTVDRSQQLSLCSLYHFRQIGGVNRLITRHASYRPRLSKFNLKFNMGHHYGRPEWSAEQVATFNEEKRIEWNRLKFEAKELW